MELRAIEPGQPIIEDTIKLSQDFWTELKPLGKIPNPRAYHTAVSYENRYKLILPISVIIFAGRDNTRGAYGDVHQLKWDESQQLNWSKIATIGDCPKYLSGHQAVVVGDDMYVYGGRVNILENSNKLFRLNLKTFRWYLMKPTGEKPIGVDGHSMVHFPEGTLNIFGGFSAKPLCKSLNYIQKYSLSSGEITIDTSETAPLGRAYHSAMSFKGRMWIYGGVDEDARFDDFWTYEP